MFTSTARSESSMTCPSPRPTTATRRPSGSPASAQTRVPRFAAAKADGVILIPMLNPTGVAAAKERLVKACERIGRDPSEIRVDALVVTAPNLSDFETRAIAYGRMVTYLQYPGNGEKLATENGWTSASWTRSATTIDSGA